MTNESQPGTKRLTITAAVILATGLAAGIALARPGTSASAGPTVGQVELSATTDVAAPGYGEVAPPAAVVAPPAATAITIQDFAFDVPASVSPGSVITVNNADAVPHTLTFTDGSIDTGTLDPGTSIALPAPATPGVYTIFCAIHPTMTGQLTVSGS